MSEAIEGTSSSDKGADKENIEIKTEKDKENISSNFDGTNLMSMLTEECDDDMHQEMKKVVAESVKIANECNKMLNILNKEIEKLQKLLRDVHDKSVGLSKLVASNVHKIQEIKNRLQESVKTSSHEMVNIASDETEELHKLLDDVHNELVVITKSESLLQQRVQEIKLQLQNVEKLVQMIKKEYIDRYNETLATMKELHKKIQDKKQEGGRSNSQ